MQDPQVPGLLIDNLLHQTPRMPLLKVSDLTPMDWSQEQPIPEQRLGRDDDPVYVTATQVSSSESCAADQGFLTGLFGHHANYCRGVQMARHIKTQEQLHPVPWEGEITGNEHDGLRHRKDPCESLLNALGRSSTCSTFRDSLSNSLGGDHDSHDGTSSDLERFSDMSSLTNEEDHGEEIWDDGFTLVPTVQPCQYYLDVMPNLINKIHRAP